MKNFIKSKLVYILIVLTIFIVIYELTNNRLKQDTSYNVQVIPELTNEKLYTFNKNIYAFNNTSVKLINNSGIVWEEDLEFSNPYSVFAKDKLAISDKNGNYVKVYSQKGHMYTVNSPTPINFFTINENGLLAIITKQNNYYEIDIYNESGDLIFGIKNISFEQGIPISCTISPNNETLVVSFLQIDGIKINSNISVYSLNSSSSLQDDNENNIFAAFLQEQQFTGILKFINNSTLLAVSDKQITLFKIKENDNSSSIKTIMLNNELEFMNVLNNEGFVISLGSPIYNTEDPYLDNTLVFYDIYGEKTGEISFDKDISSISSDLGACIVQTNRLFTAVNKNGKIIWEYQAIQDINQVIFYENINQILISSGNDVKIAKVNKKLTEKNSENIEPTNDENYNQENETNSFENNEQIEQNSVIIEQSELLPP